MCEAELDYFEHKFGNDSQNPVAAFKAACLSKVNEIKPAASDVHNLNAYPFLQEHIDALKAELPAYVAMATDVDSSMDSLEW